MGDSNEYESNQAENLNLLNLQQKLIENLHIGISDQQFEEWEHMRKQTGHLILESIQEPEDDILLVDLPGEGSTCTQIEAIPLGPASEIIPSTSDITDSLQPYTGTQEEYEPNLCAGITIEIGGKSRVVYPDKDLTTKYITGEISFSEFIEHMEKPDSSALPLSTEIACETEVTTTEIDEDDESEEEEDESLDDADWTPSLSGRIGKKKKKVRRKKTELPRHLQGLMGEANLKFARGEHDEAIKMCMEVIRLAPTAVLPFQTLGILYEDLGNKKKALQFYLIAAYLNPSDAEEWARLAEMSLDQSDIKQAINCYAKAIKNDPNNVDYIWGKCRLHEQLGEQKKVLEGYQQAMKLMPQEENDKYMQMARDMTKRARFMIKESQNIIRGNVPVETYHEMGDVVSAVQVLKAAFDKSPQQITSEDVNMLIELFLIQKEYLNAIKILVKHCGIVMYFNNNSKWSSKDEEIKTFTDPKVVPVRCHIPDILPIDLRVKLVVCSIHCKFTHIVIMILSPLLEESVEDFGDLYLDVAEAYMDNGYYIEAEPLLKSLVDSENFNVAAVWLRYGECLNSLGYLDGAVDAYSRVVMMAPSHFGARVSLSALQQQLGKTDEALKALTQDTPDEGESQQDQRLLLHKCYLLYSQGQFDEFFECSKKLLFRYFREIYRPSFTRMVFRYKSYKYRLEGLRTLLKEQNSSDFNDMQVPKDRSDSSVSLDDLWDIYTKLFQALLSKKRYVQLLEISTLGMTCPHFIADQEKSRDTEFMCLVACVLNRNGKLAYNFAKDICTRNLENNQAWNLFNQVVGFSADVRHNKFCLRLMMKNPDNVQLGFLNGHNSLLAGSYRHSLGEYVCVYRKRPTDPLVNLCIGVVYIHLASQRFAGKRHSLVVQGTAFLNNYLELRGPCQETYYNMGRAYHQLGLLYMAVPYYKRALECDPVIDDEEGLFNLQAEIAYNLALIYQGSGNKEYAKLLLYKYCVI